MKKTLTCLLLLLASCRLLAGPGPKMAYPLNGLNFVINNNPNPVTHQAVMGGTVNWATWINSTQEFYALANTIELSQYESTDLPVNFEYDLTITGHLNYKQIGSSAVHTETIKLNINNHLQGSSKRIDFYSYSNAYDSKFTIDAVTLTGTPPVGTDIYSAVAKIVELNLTIQQTHFLLPDMGAPVTISTVPCLDNTSNEMVLTWPPVAYAEEYELETLYVDDYDSNGGALPPSAIKYDFRENATRVVLKQLYYRLPMIYDRGYLLYRIRPVGRGGPDWDKRIPGPWSALNTKGTVDQFTARKQITAAEVHTLNNINWQLTTTYAEDGKRKDVVTYDDGLYMNRQTVTAASDARNIFTENINDNGLANIPGCAPLGTEKIKELLAQENIYDFNGRVGVQIMPTPTGTHKIDYIPHLNQNTAGHPYSWRDFDVLTTCALPAGALSQQGTGAFGAGQYYSPNNPNKIGYNAFIPDAGGFAFSRVQYTNDNTGRVSRQGGVGATFQLDGGRETRFYYGAPNQVELDRMFGTEVGYAQRYLKKMVVDPNGQTSITYENPEGKTIATALTGAVPSNQVALDNETRVPVVVDADLIGDNMVDSLGHSITINKQILVPSAAPYVFNYSVKGQALNYTTCDNASICLDCIYDLSLSLKSNDGCTTLPIFAYTGTFGDLVSATKVPNIDKSCFAGTAGFMDRAANFPATFTATLPPGSYTLVKTLTVNKNAAEAYVNLVYADTCRAEFNTLLQQEMSKVDTTDCNQSCATCQLAAHADTTLCVELCVKALNDCDMARKMMLTDLKPGGQYAQFSVGANGKYYSNDPLSIFNPANQLVNGHLPGLATLVNLASNNPTDALYINNVIDNWTLTTAQEDIQLQAHPEYGMLQWCNIVNTGKDYDLKLRSTDTYASAVSLGLIGNITTANDITNTYQKLLHNDPFFISNPTKGADFLNFMNATCSGENLLQMAIHGAYCSAPAVQSLSNLNANGQTGALTPPTVSTAPCVLPSGYLTSYVFGSNPAIKDLDWTMLRDFYLSYKEKYLYNSRRDYSIDHDIFNGCIGAQNFYFHFGQYPNTFFPGYPLFFGSNLPHNSYTYSVEGYIPVNAADGCGITNALYQTKIKRFTNRYDAFSHTTSQTPINLNNIDIYNDCPSAATVAGLQSQVGVITGNYLCNSPVGVPNKGDKPVVKSTGTDKPAQVGDQRGNPDTQKSDTCKTLSPFANELFDFLTGLKKPKAPIEDTYQYARHNSALYTVFKGATLIKYAYATEEKTCSVKFTGQSTKGVEGGACTINFDNCDWMGTDKALVSITPFFDGSVGATNKFTLTYRDTRTNKLLKVIGQSACLPINECKDPVLCGDSLLNVKAPPPINACAAAKILMARDNAEQRYTYWLDSMRKDLLQKYYAKCMQAAEKMAYNYSDDQYHYTLYYYDQAGNLTRTIPPAGVRLLGTADVADVDAKRTVNAGVKVPSHFFITNYKYNSLNQLTWQSLPDAGTSAFFYDKLGRIAASQNAKQRPLNYYSYTYYDLLGRTVESGEVKLSLDQAMLDNYAMWETTLHNPMLQRQDITFTSYDETVPAINSKFGGPGQQNLRSRVASIFSFANNATQFAGSYRHATHYTYDVSGNVPVVIQDYPGTPLGDKVIAYNFDQISGKVNEVRYQPGMADEFRYQYAYDDELRLTDVYTSRKGIIWQHDAEYFYYKHGPLARTELGATKVQGLDYIYTLQGWIKGVNGMDGNRKEDAGRDGIALENGMPDSTTINGQLTNITVETNSNLNSAGPGYHSLHNTVAADAFAYALSYYSDDYKPIDPNLNTTGALDAPMTGVKPLYNGNISRMYTYLQNLGGLGMNYTYDQLNRLKYQQAFTMGNNGPTALQAYEMDLNYDGNGNIINMYRLGRPTNLDMDKQAYHYYDANNMEIPNMANPPANATNRLASVTDQIPTSSYPELGSPLNGTVKDIDNQSSNNYSYDAIGNLIKDNAEDISNIGWSLQNKITNINKTSGQLLFAYDALGNRVSKKYVPATGPAIQTFYVRDASGTIMATYQLKNQQLSWTEQELYGSSRLGLWQPNQVIPSGQTAWSGTVDWQNILANPITEDMIIRGSKLYELANHLGNVLATISDNKLQNTSPNPGTSGITADLVSATDYYAFGMQMPGRTFNSGNYRFGFNGKENDNEVKGDGNEQDYGMRIYDPRLGRFLSIDPLTMKYPWYTPYQFAGNKPIQFIDLDGGEEKDKAKKSATPKKEFNLAKLKDEIKLHDQKAEEAKKAFAKNSAIMAAKLKEAEAHLAKYDKSVKKLVNTIDENIKQREIDENRAKNIGKGTLTAVGLATGLTEVYGAYVAGELTYTAIITGAAALNSADDLGGNIANVVTGKNEGSMLEQTTSNKTAKTVISSLKFTVGIMSIGESASKDPKGLALMNTVWDFTSLYNDTAEKLGVNEEKKSKK